MNSGDTSTEVHGWDEITVSKWGTWKSVLNLTSVEGSESSGDT